MSRPVMLVMDRPRERSPLLTQFYDYLARPDGTFRTVRDNRVSTPLEEIVEDRLGGPPDFVYWGFAPGSSLKNSTEFVRDNGIKVICDVGDVEQFVLGYEPVVGNFRNVGVDYLIARWPDVPEFHSSGDLKKYAKRTPWLERVEILHVPWAINPDLYPVREERDIDVSFICTTGPNWPYHRDRELARRSLLEVPGAKIGNWYGTEYLDILSRSKIFIVEGSGRNFLVQKYLEGAGCGAMLMGEIPGAAKDIFEDGVSIAEVKDYSRTAGVVLDYLERPKDIKRIAAEGRKRVLGNFTLGQVVPEFEKKIWKS